MNKVLAISLSAVVCLQYPSILYHLAVHGLHCCGGSLLLIILNVGAHPIGADAVVIVGDGDIPDTAKLTKPLFTA